MIGTPRALVIEWTHAAPADGRGELENTAAVTRHAAKEEEVA